MKINQYKGRVGYGWPVPVLWYEVYTSLFSLQQNIEFCHLNNFERNDKSLRSKNDSEQSFDLFYLNVSHDNYEKIIFRFYSSQRR